MNAVGRRISVRLRTTSVGAFTVCSSSSGPRSASSFSSPASISPTCCSHAPPRAARSSPSVALSGQVAAASCESFLQRAGRLLRRRSTRPRPRLPIAAMARSSEFARAPLVDRFGNWLSSSRADSKTAPKARRPGTASSILELSCVYSPGKPLAGLSFLALLPAMGTNAAVFF